MTQTNELHVVLGTGPLGRSVMNELVRRGRRVRMVNRSGAMKEAPPGVEVVTGDARDAGRVSALTQGAAVLYQCTQPPYTEWPQKFPPMMAAVLEGAALSGAKLVVGDNLYCYGDTGGRPIREDSPYTRRGRKGQTRAQVAEMALAAHRAGRVRVAIGRGSDFFGPHVLNAMMGERAFGPALKGRPAQLVGALDLPHTQTYIEDFGRALVILGEREEALGQAWHVPNDQPAISQRQFMQRAFEAIGRPLRVATVNRLMLTLAAPFLPMAREVLEMMYEFEKPYVVESGKFERAFGMKATPVDEAVRHTVAWYREWLKTQPGGDGLPTHAPAGRQSVDLAR